jgi:hypothetical protein
MKKILLLIIISLSFQSICFSEIPVFLSYASHSNLLFDYIGEISEVSSIPLFPAPDDEILIYFRLKRDNLRLFADIDKIILNYTIDKKNWNEIEMENFFNTGIYFCIIPPLKKEGEILYYIKIKDVLGNLLSEMPEETKEFQKEENLLIVEDLDDNDREAPPDVDIRKIKIGYNKDFLYLQLETEKELNPGTLNPLNINGYVFITGNFDQRSGLKDFMYLPVYFYAPFAKLLGILPGLYTLSDITSMEDIKNKRIIDKDIKSREKDGKLYLQIPLRCLGINFSKLYHICCFTLKIKSTENPEPIPVDVSPHIYLYLRNHKIEIKYKKPSNFKAGAARVEIIPPPGTPLAGYTDRGDKPSKGIRDPIYSSAVVLEVEKVKYALVGVDILYITSEIYQKVCERVREATEIPPFNIFLSASHTHSGPGGFSPKLGIVASNYNPEIEEYIVEVISRSIILANRNLKEAKLGIGRGEAILSGNRRIKNGPIDPEILVMRIDDKNNNPVAIYFNYSAHPVTLSSSNFYFSSDFVHLAREVINKKYPDAIPIYVNGAQGDINARARSEKPMGEELGEEVVKILQNIKTTHKIKISSTLRKLLLNEKMKFYTYISCLKINENLFLTLPGEFYCEFGLELKNFAKENNYKNVFILGLTNDGLGYFVPKDFYYERPYESLFSIFGSGSGEFIIENIKKMILNKYK